MHPYRARFAGQIIAEFLPPVRPSRRVVILCGGLPSQPPREEMLRFFSRRGFWVFAPRYRGTWESDGAFLARSPHLDVLDVINQLPRGFTEIWGGRTFRLPRPAVFLIGASFGGTAVVLASKHPLVKRVIAFSPVVDWRRDSATEPLAWLGDVIKRSFGAAYRFREEDWRKLAAGRFYSPAAHLDLVAAKKIVIYHAPDDDVVPLAPTAVFSQRTGAKLKTLRRGGHLSLSFAVPPSRWREIRKLLK